ncbi:MAG: competence/damage-inducible protein A [Clostridia bacterium]
MTAEILSIGTELLMGQIVDTNAQYISKRLAELGIDQYFRTTVGDNEARLTGAIKTALSRSDIVIMTGGLGPTGDDISKEVASAVMNKQLVYDDVSLAALKARFAAMNHEMTPNNLKQAMFPVGCIILPNPNGTAPGCIIEENNKAIALLPGPPKEMVPMFENSLMPYLQGKSGYTLYSRIMRIFGSGESQVEFMLKDMIDAQTNPTIAPYALAGELTLRITARCKDEAEGIALTEPVLKKITERLGEVVYSTNDEPLQVVVAGLLATQKKVLALAESCTGGMLASMLVSVPGCSKWFTESAVTYSDAAKSQRLGVSAETLKDFGAVSEQTATQMAQGMLRTSGAQIAVSITGIAGPDGGSQEKPVGLVYIALADADGVYTKQLKLSGSRERIRYSTCLNALDMIRQKLK